MHQKQRNPVRSTQRAFTLIEILVVIVLIGLLAALLFPVFTKTRQKSRESVCLSNLRQLHLAVSMYRQDYDGVDPSENTKSNCETLGAPCSAQSYLFLLRNYTKNKQVGICPAFRGVVTEDKECTYMPNLMIRPYRKDNYAASVDQKVFFTLGMRTPLFICEEHNVETDIDVVSAPPDATRKLLIVRYNGQAEILTLPLMKSLTIEGFLEWERSR